MHKSVQSSARRTYRPTRPLLLALPNRQTSTATRWPSCVVQQDDETALRLIKHLQAREDSRRDQVWSALHAIIPSRGEHRSSKEKLRLGTEVAPVRSDQLPAPMHARSDKLREPFHHVA